MEAKISVDIEQERLPHFNKALDGLREAFANSGLSIYELYVAIGCMFATDFKHRPAVKVAIEHIEKTATHILDEMEQQGVLIESQEEFMNQLKTKGSKVIQ
jgi:hypothetical protein